MNALRVNKAHFPVTVLGPGRRIGIWLQGCSIRCPGCVSRDTWDPNDGAIMSVSELMAWCRGVTQRGTFDGVTISGGEPFEQPAPLHQFLLALAAWRSIEGLDFDVLCYSGLPYRRLMKDFAAQLELIDILCPEPYVDDLPKAQLWRGSSNQPLVGLTDRGKAIIAAMPDGAETRRLQLDVNGGRVWLIGIPERGDLGQMQDAAASRGLHLSGVSWRP